MFSHQCLKEVELYGFSVYRETIGLWHRLVDIALSVEKVIIDVRHPYFENSPWLIINTEDLDKARDCVRGLTKTSFDRSIDVVIL